MYFFSAIGAISQKVEPKVFFKFFRHKKNLVILGYSGWGDGQLEGEMEREDWTLSEINIDLIFERDNAKKWLNAINNSFIRL